MKIQKAIQFLRLLKDDQVILDDPDTQTALHLAIEALKRDLHNRLINNHPDQAPLPGETKD